MKDRALSNQPSSKALHPASTSSRQPSLGEAVPLQVPNPVSKPSTAPTRADASTPAPNGEPLKGAKGAALLPSGPFVVRRKQAPLSNPLVASGLIGAGGLALTLAVGLTLTDDPSDQPQFSFRETPEPSPGDVNSQLAELGTLTAGTVKPATATPEFSSASRIRPAQIPQISVSRTLRGPQRALAIENMLDQQTQELDQLTRLLATQTPTQPPAEGALAQAMTPSPETAEQTAAAPGQVLPSVAALAPQTAIADLPAAPVAGTSAQAPASAGIPTGEAAPVSQQPGAIARLDLRNIQKLRMAAPTADAEQAEAEQAEAEPMAIAVSGEFAPAAEMAINPSMNLAQYTATVPVDLLEEVYSMQTAGQQPGAVQPIMAVAPLMPESADETETAASEGPTTEAPTTEATGDQGIRYFVSLEQESDNARHVWMLPLTDQAATEVASADKVEAFRVFRLPEQEYQRVWLAVRSVNPAQDAAAPLYGFIDYQRQIIVMPVATAATTPVPASPAS